MPAAIAIPALASVIAGGAAAGASVYGAHKQSSAANKAAKLSTDAANHAADVGGQSAREALDFQKQEAERTAAQAEADRKANYDQWAAGMNAHNAARARYGYGTTAVPAYVPGKVPSYTNSPGAALMGQGGPVPAPAPTTAAPVFSGGGYGAGINPPGRAPLASNPNTGVLNPNSVGSMLMPPTGPPLGYDPTTQVDPRLPARPASRSIGASLYGGR